jgi:hypothetical protein
MPNELSGAQWVSRFPTSRTTDTLSDDFRPKCEAFLAALRDAGASITISATFRPPERAYLMHWSFVIHTGEVDPTDVPAMTGVAIDWVHRKTSGSPDVPASRAAAAAMVDGYDIAFRPSLTSLHSVGKAIDMTIGWKGDLTIAQKNGNAKTITTQPRSGLNHTLWAVGATYGVIKLASDKPHWSINGH